LDPAAELGAILDALFGFGYQQIERHGDFLPFAGVIAADGGLRLVASDVAEEQALAEDVLEDLYRGLASEAATGAIRAAGVCVDVLVTRAGSQTKSDALRVDLEHAAGAPVRAFLPYRKKRLQGYEWGEPFTEQGPSRLRFTSPP
jgi:hypothetical protein